MSSRRIAILAVVFCVGISPVAMGRPEPPKGPDAPAPAPKPKPRKARVKTTKPAPVRQVAKPVATAAAPAVRKVKSKRARVTSAPVVSDPPVTAPAAVAPPAALSADQLASIARDFARLWAARDAFGFQQTAEQDAYTASQLVESNAQYNNPFVGEQGRVVYRKATNKTCGYAWGYIVNLSRMNAQDVLVTATSWSSDLSGKKTLRVERGVGFVGIDPKGVARGYMGFDNFLVEVSADDIQTAQDELFVLATNMGIRLSA
jgi:hypothetical protein